MIRAPTNIPPGAVSLTIQLSLPQIDQAMTPLPITTDQLLSIGHIVPWTEAEGPGKRFALWFQGCPMRCPGCCNPEFIPFSGGEQHRLADVIDAMDQARAEHGIEGITLLGGEPLAHVTGAADLAVAARERDLTVMVFSGYTIEEIAVMPDPDVPRLLDHTDILVDGPYVREQPDETRRWIGSSNQRIHFLSEKYSESDAYWSEPDTLEIRLTPEGISVNGFPARSAIGLWKGWKRRKSNS